MRELARDEVPQEFIEALDDFEKERFVPMKKRCRKLGLRELSKPHG